MEGPIDIPAPPESAPRDKPDGDIDVALHAAIGRMTGGLSPASLATAWLDWSLHLLGSPNKQSGLATLAAQNLRDAWGIGLRAALGTPDEEEEKKTAEDKRFRDPAWRQFPYNAMCRWFLLQQGWWDAATKGLHGVARSHENIVNFTARQWLDLLSPGNYPLTNPIVLSRTREEAGANLVRGLQNWIEDLNTYLSGPKAPQSEYRVGETIAVTPGTVVYRNELIELIRYAPTTKQVRPEPVLIVPAWIMKYYILDLSPHNSLVRYLRDQGFEVYILSWKNPDAEDAGLSMADYLDLGVMAALDAIGKPQIHGVGYCLGGSLFAIAAAAMARDGDERLKTLSLLAAQVDFTEAGEISLFINEAQVAFLEDIMKAQGYLRADQMAGAFRMLRSNDLIWSRVIRHYLLGERTEMNDLMAWNADSTRMPARMHSEYLRWLFLENQLARGLYRVHGQPVALTDIRTPLFCVGTEKDHVSPWRSVYKLNLLTDGDVTFLLTRGGHNAGIVSEPGHPRRHYRVGKKRERQRHVSADDWMASHFPVEGSWWPKWVEWLAGQSGAPVTARKRPPADLGPAPGRYVFG